MMIALTLALSLLAQPQRRPPPPPPPAPIDVAAVAQHAARLAVLEHRKQQLEAEVIEARRQFGFGENHPQLVVLLAKLAEADKALVTEKSAWHEGEIDRLVARRSELLRLQVEAVSERGLGPNHPEMRSLNREIADVNTRLTERSKTLLQSGVEQALLRETAKKDTQDLDAFLRLAKLYAAAGRTADAERVLLDAVTLLRARGK